MRFPLPVIQQSISERSLYERRAGLLRKIAGFWPLALEQAPPEIDQYIQPGDAAVLGNFLEDIEVTRFEVGASDGSAATKDNSEPRSFAIRFTFAENDIFEDRVLEKRFWYRHAPVKEAEEAKEAEEGDKKTKKKKQAEAAESWSGIVSEPVAIKWKKDKDQTGGLLDLAVKVYQEGEKSDSVAALTEELSKTAMGGISFFAWFGYVGRRISAEESKAAAALKREQRAERAAKRAKGEKEEAEEEDEDDEDEDDAIEIDDDSYEYEIFPDGDIVALAFAEDLWPNAIKYFRQAQEEETLSDLEFEDMDEDEDEDEDEDDDEDDEGGNDAPPSKKQRK